MIITLANLIKSVREEKLSREDLEKYQDQMIYLFAEIQLELAEIRKAKALYFIEKRTKTDKDTDRNWQASKGGLREIDLAHYSKALEKLLSSLKSRIYKLIY